LLHEPLAGESLYETLYAATSVRVPLLADVSGRSSTLIVAKEFDWYVSPYSRVHVAPLSVDTTALSVPVNTPEIVAKFEDSARMPPEMDTGDCVGALAETVAAEMFRVCETLVLTLCGCVPNVMP
jgi:hypothetical protein